MLVTVDLTEDVWDPYPNIDLEDPPDGRLVTQQLVWTVLGALGTDAPVLVTVDGEPARGIWLHRLDGPVTLAPDLAELVAPSAGPAYQRWLGRSTLASCGVVDTGRRPSELTVGEQAGYDCLESARDAGEGAELQVDQVTVEGDPVTSWYRVTPEGRLEVYTDATADAFGSGRWEYAPSAAFDRAAAADAAPDLPLGPPGRAGPAPGRDRSIVREWPCRRPISGLSCL